MELSKVRSREEIIAQFKDGQTIAIGGQTNQYMPDRLIDCLLESGAKHLTVYSIDSSDPGHGVSLLLENGASAQEVGYMVGFKNRSHFSQAFKKRFGLAPVNYLKQYSGNNP